MSRKNHILFLFLRFPKKNYIMNRYKHYYDRKATEYILDNCDNIEDLIRISTQSITLKRDKIYWYDYDKD